MSSSSPCALVVHFHFCKSAGTALRAFLSAGSGVHRKDGWNLLDWSVPKHRKRMQTVYHEQHGGNFWHTLKQVAAVRAALKNQQSHCQVVTLALLRDPAEQLISAYHYPSWAQSFKAQNGSLLQLARLLGPDYFWSAPSLSCRGIDQRDAKSPSLRSEPCHRSTPGTCSSECNATLWTKMNGFLGQLDVVASVREYSTVALEMAHVLGFGQGAWERIRWRIGPGPWGWSSWRVLCNMTRPRRPRPGPKWTHEAHANVRDRVRPWVPCSGPLHDHWIRQGERLLSRRVRGQRRLDGYCKQLAALASNRSYEHRLFWM